MAERCEVCLTVYIYLFQNKMFNMNEIFCKVYLQLHYKAAFDHFRQRPTKHDHPLR